MEILKRYRRNRPIEHPVYTRAEAEEKRLCPVAWRSAVCGEWGITDDGFVVQCLARNEYTTKRGTATFLRFTIGGVWLTRSAKLEWLSRKISKGYGSGTKTWVEIEMGKTRFKNLLKAYVTQYMYGKVDWEQLGRIYRGDDPRRAETARRIMKRPEVQKMVDESLKEALTKAGVTREWVLALLPKALEVAVEGGDADVVLKIFKESRDLVGLAPESNHAESTLPDFTPYEQIIEGEKRAREISAEAAAEAEPILPPQDE